MTGASSRRPGVSSGTPLDAPGLEKYRESIRGRFDGEANPLYATARLWEGRHVARVAEIARAHPRLAPPQARRVCAAWEDVSADMVPAEAPQDFRGAYSRVCTQAIKI